jgi:hypothetical protein
LTSIESAEGLRLNLGCGARKMAGYVNVDREASVRPDLLVDLETFPWPFESGAVGEIQMLHVLEHLGRESQTFFDIMCEIYRVCRDNAAVRIVVPHHRSESYAGDPTHVRPITAKGMTMFSKDYCRAFAEQGWSNTRLAEYLDVDFGIERVTCTLTPYWRARLRDKIIDYDEINHAIVTYYNVVEQIEFILRIVKSKGTQDTLGHTDGNLSFMLV